MISGNHVSIKLWTPYIGKDLPLSCKKGKVYDKHTVAVLLLGTHLRRFRVSSGFSCSTKVLVKAFCTSAEVSHVIAYT